MKAERWRFCLHESGHGLSAIVLGGRCLGLVIFDDGTGGLSQADELLGNREAYSIAAGPAAEILASRFPVPEVAVIANCINVDNLETSPLFASSPMLACQMARTPDTRKHFDSDDRALALWAIDGNESEPERWASRVALARRIASEIVERHADAIVRVATALFASGSLCRDEITELLKDKSE